VAEQREMQLTIFGKAQAVKHRALAKCVVYLMIKLLDTAGHQSFALRTRHAVYVAKPRRQRSIPGTLITVKRCIFAQNVTTLAECQGMSGRRQPVYPHSFAQNVARKMVSHSVTTGK
jgi:hypothetical protein